jgi:hypothetical protein
MKKAPLVRGSFGTGRSGYFAATTRTISRHLFE